MGVGGIRGGGKGGGVKGAKGAGAAAKTSFGGKVDKSESLVGASGMVQGANVGQVGPTDPVAASAMEIARQVKSGQIKTREEAARKLVADILKEKLRMQSKALTEKIAQSLQDDPRLTQTLERIWAKG